MKKTAFSMMSLVALSHLTYAGGDIAPVEPVVETLVAVESTSAWKNEFTIYGWLPTISAKTPFPNSTGTSVEASDIIDDLKMVFLGTYAVRYNKWSFIADVLYADLGDSTDQAITFPDGRTIDASVSIDMKTLLLNAGVGYTIVDSEKWLLDVTAGIRYLDLEVDVSTNHPLLGLSDSEDFTDVFVGVRGAYNINENWYLPYEADIGTGDSEVSYQLFAGIGYRYDWGDIKLGYRYLDYDMGDGHIVEDLALSGGIMGVSIKF